MDFAGKYPLKKKEKAFDNPITNRPIITPISTLNEGKNNGIIVMKMIGNPIYNKEINTKLATPFFKFF